MEIDEDSFIEECNNLPQSINHNSCPLCKKMKEHETFNNHLRNCKSLNLLINRTYSVCKYSCLHIIRTKYLEKHEKICTYNYDEFSDYEEEELDSILFNLYKAHIKNLLTKKTYVDRNDENNKLRKEDSDDDSNNSNSADSDGIYDNRSKNSFGKNNNDLYQPKREYKIDLLYDDDNNINMKRDTFDFNFMLFGKESV